MNQAPERLSDMKELYQQYKKELTRFAISLTKQEMEAEDLVQETFSKALKNQELLKDLPSYKIRAWLYKVLKNKFLDQKRKKRHERYVEESDEPVFHVGDYNDIEMMELLDRLPGDLKDIVVKRYWLNMTSKQIGEQYEVPASTVRYRLQVAINLLREWII
ncbi:RNA polymerase sigma factor [Pseudalkalibacillus caeni]|uniref:RNA polymerase sigma factor n=1 Tax=Exobacillus caeni TaxID=2574798 RepID=A0A5R9F962_9BACL|nr:RNA polymerase sigma factor [Pseudalkalibacillus caeni]TLS36245.1 RNA polymerase sigma factor [Pseudalkalibacillus caeni]